ncbi:hypothetical protein [Solihabitans fulvus]|uniref:hypothetical protein n=1 Tax=Solihabitans fulvus TaxID=1892852 RepID=UPI001661ED19|nr:hypothetical protein [Solihabitans fulvus]
MSQPPVQMDQAQQDQLVRQIGRALLRALPPDWQQVRAEYRAAGRHIEVDIFVAGPDRVPRPIRPPMEVVQMLGELRAGMYLPGVGTWLSAIYQLTAPSDYSVDFSADAEPPWRNAPPPIGFQDELRTFPRADERIPDWLRQRAGLPPLPPPPPEPVQGTPPQGAPPQGTPSQGVPQQGGQQQGFPPQGDQPPGFPQQSGQPQGFPPQGDQQQGFPPQGAQPQGVPQQGPPPQGFPAQGFPEQGVPQQGGQPQGTPPPGFPVQGGPSQSTPPHGFPAQGAPQQGFPAQGMPQEGVPQQGVPQAGGSQAALRTAKVFDGTAPTGRPFADRPPLAPDERDRLLAYLDSAPIVLAARSYDTDELAPDEPPAVPLTFRTDGAWIWAGAVSYYLGKYRLPPDPELLAHIRGRGYELPEVDEATKARAVTIITGH